MILDKAKMAHDWAMKHGKVDSNYNRENTVQLAWDYADAMQAEEDKRVSKGRPEVLRDDPFECLHPLIDWHKYGKGLYHFWAMDEDGQAFWHNRKPKINGGKWDSYHKYKAPPFDYHGNWQDSLRKRP